MAPKEICMFFRIFFTYVYVSSLMLSSENISDTRPCFYCFWIDLFSFSGVECGVVWQYCCVRDYKKVLFIIFFTWKVFFFFTGVLIFHGCFGKVVWIRYFEALIFILYVVIREWGLWLPTLYGVFALVFVGLCFYVSRRQKSTYSRKRTKYSSLENWKKK